MIISHKHKFIFIKTKKTAGTSIEIYLSKFCGKNDIITPIRENRNNDRNHVPKNYKGVFNPIPSNIELVKNFISKNIDYKNFFSKSYETHSIRKNLSDFLLAKKFYNHIPAWMVKNRISNKIWKNYYKFCIERNPWDKTISHYYWLKNGLFNNLTFDHYINSGNFRLNYPFYMDINFKKIIVDRVCKYENLNDELSEVFDKIGIPFDGNLNVRAKGKTRKDRSPYRKFFSGNYSKYNVIIESVFSKEIELFNYNF